LIFYLLLQVLLERRLQVRRLRVLLLERVVVFYLTQSQTVTHQNTCGRLPFGYFFSVCFFEFVEPVFSG